ncbi:MAG: MFS transporter [Actinobacteria bacterium]|jgi:EmrB/QacA subfamily drug resistance transporter|nr:MFS transporter [Actinomycetota bacterium]MCL6094773.1 MFS transporter [Actinomycetota bacterium]
MLTIRRKKLEGTAHTKEDLALAVIVTGVLMTAIDTTIVVLALPSIERDLHIGLASVIWVIISYLLIITVLATQVGKLGDMFGRVKMYQFGFLVFIIGSLLCALSWNEASIVTFRLIQGVGGALIASNAGAVIADTFPPERRGRAYGYNAVGWSMGAVVGILLGGLLITYISWRWVFWINVPIGAVAFIAALRVLHDPGKRQKHKLDIGGTVTLGLGLYGVLWAMTRLATNGLDATLAGYLIGGIILLIAFVILEHKVEEPTVDLSLFRVPTLAPSLLASFFQSLANFSVLFLVIMYLQGSRHLSPIDASLLLIPGYLLGVVVAPYSGRLSDRRNPVLPATAGLTIQVIALLVYAQLGMSTGLWMVVLASVINGIGGSSFFPANNSAVMKAAPSNLFGVSSGMLRTFSNIGLVFSFSLAILITSRSIPRGLAFAIFVGTKGLVGPLAAAFANGIHAAFYASSSFLVIAAVLSATRAKNAKLHLSSAPKTPTEKQTDSGDALAELPQETTKA